MLSEEEKPEHYEIDIQMAIKLRSTDCSVNVTSRLS